MNDRIGRLYVVAREDHAKTCPVPCCASLEEALRLGICTCGDEPNRTCPTHFPSYYRQPAPFDRDEFDRVVSAIYTRPWDDPGRFESLFAPALAALGTFALAEPGLDGEYARAESARVIRRMMRRVIDGETHIETEDHR